MWYNKIVADLSSIPGFIDYYEQQLISARSEISVRGKLEKAISDLPGITEYRFNQLQEVEAVLNFSSGYNPLFWFSYGFLGMIIQHII